MTSLTVLSTIRPKTINISHIPSHKTYGLSSCCLRSHPVAATECGLRRIPWVNNRFSVYMDRSNEQKELSKETKEKLGTGIFGAVKCFGETNLLSQP